ncbi:MAG TPA: dihydrofolate reductase family protein [Miltoncostaeaceae bacterium]|nr:dihydrofolate reductase family protein [Miltoncostaeaceae bacterium]
MARDLIYSMGMSLDGYVTAPDGGIDWAVPDDELHRFHNARMRETDTHLMGRRLYETMRYWDTADQNPDAGEIELEFARVWKQTERLVFSTTLDRVDGDARLVRGDLVEEVTRLKELPGGSIGAGGAGLAATLIAHDLVDEYGVFVHPVVLGGGTPFLPASVRRDLRLAETRAFGGGVVYLRYRR